MSLNLPLNLNMTEVVGSKGNSDRAPLWGEEPVAGDFGQLFQDNLNASGSSDESIANNQNPSSGVPTKNSGQEFAALERNSQPADLEQQALNDTTIEVQTIDDEVSAINTDGVDAELLALIANARSYDVTLEKPAANELATQLSEISQTLRGMLLQAKMQATMTESNGSKATPSLATNLTGTSNIAAVPQNGKAAQSPSMAANEISLIDSNESTADISKLTATLADDSVMQTADSQFSKGKSDGFVNEKIQANGHSQVQAQLSVKSQMGQDELQQDRALTAEIAPDLAPATSSNTSGGGANNPTAPMPGQKTFVEHQKQQQQQQQQQQSERTVSVEKTQKSASESDTSLFARNFADVLPEVTVPRQMPIANSIVGTSAFAAPSTSMNNAVMSPLGQTNPLENGTVATIERQLQLLEPNAAMQLRDRVLYQFNQKIHTAEVRISPEDLGSVQIKVNLQQDQLAVQFVVQQANAKELIEQQMPKLKELLQQQGMDLTEGQVEQRQSNDRQGSQQPDERQANRGYAIGKETEGELLPLATKQSKASERMVDYYA